MNTTSDCMIEVKSEPQTLEATKDIIEHNFKHVRVFRIIPNRIELQIRTKGALSRQHSRNLKVRYCYSTASMTVEEAKATINALQQAVKKMEERNNLTDPEGVV